MLKQLRYKCSLDYLKHRQNIFQLHKANYGKVSETLYDSLYLRNPYGVPLLGLCIDGQKLVGQENYIRQDVVSRGSIYRSAIGINTIVDSKYRLFYGVFKNLVLLTMNKMKDKVDVLCAFANEESKEYYLRYFNWQVSSRVQVYKKGIGYKGFSAETLLTLLKPGHLSKHFKLKEAKEFDPRILDPIIEEHRKISKYTYFYKTADFLNWKFLKNSHYNLTGYLIEFKDMIQGYVVTYEDGIELKIIDFLIENDDREILEKLIGTLSYIGSQRNKKRVVVYATPSCWYLRSLKKHFFIHRWDFDFITANISRVAIDNQWVIQMGDFDVL